MYQGGDAAGEVRVAERYAGSGAWPYGGPSGPPRLSSGAGQPAALVPALSPQKPARRRRVIVAVAVAAAVAAAAVTGVVTHSSPAPSPQAVVPTSTPTAADPAIRNTEETGRLDAAVTLVLTKRATALAHGDLAGWLKDVDSTQPALVAHEKMVFTNLRKLPLGSYGWVEQSNATSANLATSQTATNLLTDHTATYSRGYRLRYAFRGYDASTVQDDYVPIFLLRGDRWLLAGDQTSTAGTRRAEPWDKEPIVVGTGKHALVVLSASDAKKLPSVVKQADAAVGKVTAMWPSGWAHRVVVYDTRNADVFSTYLGRNASISDFDGLTVGMGHDDATRASEPLRVVANPRYEPPGSKNLPALLTHEFTHVAKWADVGDGTPLWSIEGIAEYTTYRGHPYDQRVAEKIGKDGRSGHLPKSLPTASGFYHGGITEAYDYGMAWLAFEYMSETYGESKVRLVYERLAKISTPEDSAASRKAEAAAFQAVLHMSEAKFVSGLNKWIARVIRPVH